MIVAGGSKINNPIIGPTPSARSTLHPNHNSPKMSNNKLYGE